MTNVHGRIHPFIAFIIFLMIVLVMPLSSLLQDTSNADSQMDQLLQMRGGRIGLLVFQGVMSLILFVGVPLIFIKISGVRIRDAFFNSFSMPKKDESGEILSPEKKINYDLPSYILVLVFVFLSLPLIGWAGELNSKIPFPEKLIQMEKSMAEVTRVLTEFNGIPELLVGILVIGLVAGIGEEITFRGIMQNQIRAFSKNKHLAIWLSALVFSAIHMQFLGFIPRMLLGAAFGYIYLWSGNLTLAMFGHFANNTIAVIGLYMYNHKMIDVNPEATDSVPLSVGVVSVLICTGALVFLKRYLTMKNPQWEKQAE